MRRSGTGGGAGHKGLGLVGGLFAGDGGRDAAAAGAASGRAATSTSAVSGAGNNQGAATRRASACLGAGRAAA